MADSGSGEQYTRGLRWWKTNKNEVHSALYRTAENTRRNDSERRNDDLRHIRLYGGRQALGLSASTYFRHVRTPWGEEQRIRWNIIQSMVDAVQAKIAKNKPRPMFLTTGGDYGIQSKGKRLGRYVDGVFYQNRMYETGPEIFRDGGIIGTGVVKIFRRGGRIVIERVFPWELFVDNREALHSTPRSLFQFKLIDREVLAALFPDKKRLIFETAQYTESEYQDLGDIRSGMDTMSDQLRVVEGWHLPSGKDTGDGRHVISLPNGSLQDVEYKRNKFPFAFMRWSNRPAGFWGQGLAEQLTSTQIEINTILQGIQENFHLGSQPFVFVERGTKVNTRHLNNRRFNIIEYTGGSGPPPQIQVFRTTHPEVYEHLERLYHRAYEIAGISELSATSRKPPGLESGRALLVYSDIETERFIIPGRRYEQWFMDVAEHILELSREADAVGKPLSVKGRRTTVRTTVIEKINWSQVNLKEDAFEMQMMPASSLPNSTWGRTAIVEQWMKMGWLDRTEAMQLLDFPDTEGFIKYQLAAIENIQLAIETMLEGPEKDDALPYLPPEPYDDHALAMKIVPQAYNRARLDGVPEERLELFREYMDAVAAFLEQAKAQAMAQSLAAEGPPPPQLPAGAPPVLGQQNLAAELPAAPTSPAEMTPPIAGALS